ncbi:MAG: hypothetical protein B7Z73_04015, partial [Planctomycetia bacterium 21-64-5]
MNEVKRTARHARVGRAGFCGVLLLVCGGIAAAEEAKPPDAEVARKRAAEELKQADADRDGKVSLSEFLKGAKGDDRGPERWQFFEWDADEDERLSLDELARRGKGSKLSALNDFRRRDENDDRRLSLEELVARQPETVHAWLRQRFVTLDFDGTGDLDWEEFRTISSAPSERGAIPDPIAELQRQAVEKWREVFAAADADGDGALSREEWPAERLAAAAPEVAEVAFQLWDGDASGTVTPEEGDRLLEIAYGLRRPDGRPLRTSSGLVMSWYYVRALDGDHDGALSRDEFVPKYHQGEAKSAEMFAKLDADRDGRLDDDEMTSIFWPDTLGQFFGLDADRDARLTTEELLKIGYGIAVGWRTVRAFDDDGDGNLSFREFRGTTFTNPSSNWYILRRDADNDGRLSWKEFYIESAPVLVAQCRYFFQRFDLDKDGYLSANEWDFTIDFNKLPAQVAMQAAEQRVRAWDSDGDGKTSLAEHLKGHAEAQRGEARRGFFRLDLDGDALVGPDEYVRQAKGTKPSLRSAFRARDVDDDGGLTLEEHVAAVGPAERARAARDFRIMDSDHDERLSPQEFGRIPDMGRPEERLPPPNPTIDALEKQLALVLEVFDREDADRDALLNVREWPAAKLGDISPELAATAAAAWDADRDGAISKDECRRLLEVAYALRRPGDGASLRTSSGLMLNYGFFRTIDRGGDGSLSYAEFVTAYSPARDKNGEAFRRLDQNHDNELSLDELNAPGGLYIDPVQTFTAFDVNLDGYVDQAELSAKANQWQRHLASRLVPAFDDDQDGRLSLYEFLATPYATVTATYYAPRRDKNNDGQLSWAEFRGEEAPFAVELGREYFRRFDLDGDGVLSYREFPCHFDLAKLPADVAFGVKDMDGDGKVAFAEVFSEPVPAESDAAARQAYESRLAEAKKQFQSQDADHNDALDREEFANWQRLAIEAAQQQALAEARKRTLDELERLDKGGDRRLDISEFLAGTTGNDRSNRRWQFFAWDVDEDRRLNLDELIAKGQGTKLSMLNDFRRRDEDDDQRLTLPEFVARHVEAALPWRRQRFRVVDFDGDGKLEWEEFRNVDSPIEERGTVPDPIVDLARQASAEWEAAFASADGNEDGKLSHRDWPGKQFEAATPAMAGLPFEAWDRDRDGNVDRDEGRWLIEVAFGLVRPDGRPLRQPSGRVLSWYYTRALDANHDGAVSREEFVSKHHQGKEKNAVIFEQLDSDRDGRMNDDEMAAIFWTDTLGQFCGFDADRDGRLTTEELLKIGYAKSVARHTVSAFDDDADGTLTFREFRGTPFANPVSNWYAPRRDADNDGRLSWKEFYIEEPPVLSAVNRYVFDRFDLDKNGFLTADEWEYAIDFDKAPPEASFRVKDLDGDGKLMFAEVFA